jgi:hypothetical protein
MPLEEKEAVFIIFPGIDTRDAVNHYNACADKNYCYAE